MKKYAMSNWLQTLRRHPVLIVGLGLILLLCAAPHLLDALWGNVPIVFYGRVVDESGKGVAGAEVIMRVSAIERLSVPVPFGAHQTSWPVKAVTGNDGTFEIRGGRGISIQLVEIKKPGYAYLSLRKAVRTLFTRRTSKA